MAHGWIIVPWIVVSSFHFIIPVSCRNVKQHCLDEAVCDRDGNVLLNNEPEVTIQNYETKFLHDSNRDHLSYDKNEEDGDATEEETVENQDKLQQLKVQESLTYPWRECRDDHELCSFMASAGECNKNPAFMSRNCMKSCLLCAYEMPGL